MKNKAAILVCVTGQRDCDRLIRVGKKLAEERSVPMQVLCVQATAAATQACCEELEYLRQTARDASAEMTVYFHDEPAFVAAGFVKQIGATHIVTGMAEAPTNGFIDVVHDLVPMVPISMVSREGIVYNIFPSEHPAVPRRTQTIIE